MREGPLCFRPYGPTPLIPPDPPLDEGTVALRPWTDADVPALVAACQDPEIPRWTNVSDSCTEADAESWFAGHADGMSAGRELSLAIVSSGSGDLLGSIALRVREHRVGDIGYWVASGARRQGVASAALRLLSGWAIGHLHWRACR